jgi:crotonobetainyl-CoA:carnitine CoA-transferase CaiB-like acyl-CoA transferase
VLPLEGLRVLDLSRLLPGPYATLVLADLGADVVAVEEPNGGDRLRSLPSLAGFASAAFESLHRNKRSLAIDLRREEGVAAFLRVARGADVLVESFRPGVMGRMGLSYEVLEGINPRLVFCSLTGYGQDGPYAGRAGHDLDYAAFSGVLGMNGPNEAPSMPGVPLADLAGGSWPAVAAILAALVGRERTGKGTFLDVSMLDGALALLSLPLSLAWARGAPLARGRELLSGKSACYGIYRTKDARFAALAALEPKFFATFCAAVGHPELVGRQFENGGEGPRSEIEAIFASRTQREWEQFASEHDACVAPVREGDEPTRDPQLVARGDFFDLEAPPGKKATPCVATPIRLPDSPKLRRPAPSHGQHTSAVLEEAGLSRTEISTLREAGVVFES